LEIKNSADRDIFKEVYSLASIMLSKNIKDPKGKALIKFAAWLDGKNTGVQEIREKSLFGGKVTPHGTASAAKLSDILMTRQKEIKELSARLLYIVVAAAIDPANKQAALEFRTMKNRSYDLNFSKLLKDAKKPELADLAELAKKTEARDKEIDKENAAHDAQYDDRKKLPAAEIEKLLDLLKFKNFSYSEASILDAINRLTHKLYWRGVQVTISGNRVSYTETKRAVNGALYYSGPLYQPKTEEFILSNKTLREILMHFGANIELVYGIKDGEIAIFDGEESEFSDIPEDGFVAKDLRDSLKGYDLKTMNKYRGKVFKMNGVITGIGRGFDSRDGFFALDGGLIRVNFKTAALDKKVYKRLDKAYEAWKKDGGLKAYHQKLREAKKSGEELEGSAITIPTLYIKFKAKCIGMDRDRLIFDNPEYILVESSGEYIMVPKSKMLEN
jgi:hypothetical protein